MDAWCILDHGAPVVLTGAPEPLLQEALASQVIGGRGNGSFTSLSTRTRKPTKSSFFFEVVGVMPEM